VGPKQDPTESVNLALKPTLEESQLIEEMVALRDALESAPDTVGDLGWVYGFRDPSGKPVDACMGPKTGSAFCGYGAEFSCAVMGTLLKSTAIGQSPTPTSNVSACQVACRAAGPEACAWWQFEVPSSGVDGELNDGAKCIFKAMRGEGSIPCPKGSQCAYGPAICPY
jgi:hypothetical protein